jgi:hypothetical protein
MFNQHGVYIDLFEYALCNKQGPETEKTNQFLLFLTALSICTFKIGGN